MFVPSSTTTTTIGFSTSLFNQTTSSSPALYCCGQEAGAATAQARPLHAAPTETFSWSDFPIIVHQEEDDCFAVRMPAQPAETYWSSSPPTSHTPSASSQSIEHSHQSFCSTTKNKNKKNVRFAQSLEIRTYSLVLGNHPWCEDNLALELGWEYNSLRCNTVDLQSYENCKQQQQQLLPTGWSTTTRPVNNEGPRRRSYLERKRLLLEVGGCTKEELEDRNDATFTIVLYKEKEGHQKEQHLYQQQQSQTRISRVGSINNCLSRFSAAA